IAARRPLEILLKLRVPGVAVVPLDPTSPSDAEWQRLARLDTLWYVRRRNLSRRLERPATKVTLQNEVGLQTLDLFQPFRLELSAIELRERADTTAWSLLAQTFSKVAPSRILVEGALREAESKHPINQAEAEKLELRYMGPEVKPGLDRLQNLKPGLLEAASKAGGISGTILTPLGYAVTGAAMVPDLGRVAHDIPTDPAVVTFANQLVAAVGGKSGKSKAVQEAVKKLILAKRKELDQ
ncbi:MAG TPA: hypothetical protein VF414_06905, partial [Thermoanaerobaculia bacterium]